LPLSLLSSYLLFRETIQPQPEIGLQPFRLADTTMRRKEGRSLLQEVTMRKMLAAAALICLALASPSRSADADDARNILERGIVAHGGERLAKARMLVRAVKGVIESLPQAVKFGGEAQLSLPDKGRWAFELERDKEKLPIVLVLNGDKGWRSGAGAVKELSSQELNDLREEVYVNWVITLLPVMEKKFDLATAPEIKVNGQAASGIKVASKGQPEVKLYFDKRTGLLVKAEHKGKEAGLDVIKEYIFSDHKAFEGVKLPTKWLAMTNGKRVAEWVVTSYKFPEKFDAAVFGKP
jgi:hypothetical protein